MAEATGGRRLAAGDGPAVLADLVRVETAPAPYPDAGAAVAVFAGQPTPGRCGRMFGGQLIGQAVSAASATVTGSSGRAAHSLHASFLRPGRVDEPLRYDVETLRDGRAFSVRFVRAWQLDRLVMTATVSFHERAAGLSHSVAPLAGYPGPEQLDSDEPDSLEGRIGGHRAFVDIRRVPASLDPRRPAAGQAVWLRARDRAGTRSSRPGTGPGSDVVDRAVLAMSADFTALETVLHGHGFAVGTPGLELASLDHCVWWHGQGGLDDWVLYTQESPWAGEERGLVTGRIHDRAGALLASIVQEGLFRRSGSSPKDGRA